MTETAPSGLSDNGAGALAYVTFIPAIIFLMMPPYNQSSYVRFHAWQSIFLNVVGFALWIVMIFVMILMPGVMWFMVMMVRLLIFLALFVAWLICVMKALNGARFGLPIIGPLAAKQAGA
jgi:uncharacterized membrane protein